MVVIDPENILIPRSLALQVLSPRCDQEIGKEKK
jgi:hypothetical protein